jgi:hypothetical protein
MSELGALQEKFASMVPELINRAIAAGYGVRIGDCFRDPRTNGEMGVKLGYGHAKSAHKLKIAIDLNLFVGGELVKDARGHDELHTWWRSIGGAASIPGDSNHYSLEYQGMR